MRTDFFVQYKGLEVSKGQLVRRIKDSWLEKGRLIREIDSLSMYYNADEGCCYYVINDNEHGSIRL